MIHHTLGTAAIACGINKSTVLRAIKAGKISAARNEHGEWQIDPAELHRVYPPAPAPDAEQPEAPRDRTDELVAQLREQLADMRNDRDRARADADVWRVAFEQERAQRALPAPGNDAQSSATAEPASRFRRTWRWLRAAS